MRTAESAVANYGKINNAWREVGRPRPHESAVLHVLGEATYTDDIPEVQATLHAALPLPPADS